MMVWMRNMRGAGSRDESADPGKSRKDHVHNSAEHEDQKGAVPIAELAKEETQNTIAETEEEPANQTRSQEITGSAEKAKNGNRSEKAENPVAEAEEEPPDETGSQEIARRAEKAQNGNGRKKAEDAFCGEIALPRQALEKRDMIGNHQPDRKNQGEANADVDAGADSRVAEEVKPTIAGQM